MGVEGEFNVDDEGSPAAPKAPVLIDSGFTMIIPVPNCILVCTAAFMP
jgi:hypothetical protein